LRENWVRNGKTGRGVAKVLQRLLLVSGVGNRVFHKTLKFLADNPEEDFNAKYIAQKIGEKKQFCPFCFMAS